MSQTFFSRLSRVGVGADRAALKDEELRCSFCDKSEAEVGKLIANPSDRDTRAFICDECVRVCSRVLKDPA